MIILAIDQSTETGSAALLDGQQLLASRCWSDARFSRQQMFPSLKSMLAEAGLKVGAIQLYVVGLGPGSYGGLRIAMAAVNAMALPDKTPVYGVTSAEVLAWQAAEAEDASLVRIVGDARRDQWWTRVFRREGACMRPVDGWELVQSTAFTTGPGEVVATPDWERIGRQLQEVVPRGVKLIAGAMLPNAETLGRLAAERMALGIVSEPLAPIYLHSAVNSTLSSPGAITKQR